MTIRETLAEANRLHEVMAILTNIFSIEDADLPVNLHFNVEGDATSRVAVKNLRKGAGILLSKIDSEPDEIGFEITEKENWFLMDLGIYVESKLQLKQMNYANAVSHNHLPTYFDLEEIRTWSILDNLLTQVLYLREDTKFYIPEAWKRKGKYISKAQEES